MHASQHKQRGLTFISLTLVLGLIAFFTLLVLKIGPLYLNNRNVVSSLADLKNMPDLVNKSKTDIRASLDKRFNLSYVEGVHGEDITVVAQPGYVKVDVEYERIEPIFGNLSVLVQFHEGFETGSR